MMAAAFAIVASVTLFGKGERQQLAVMSAATSGGPVFQTASKPAPPPER